MCCRVEGFVPGGEKGDDWSRLHVNTKQYAERMYASKNGIPDAAKDASEDDVGAEIEKELQGLKKPQTEPLFLSIKLDTPCRQSCSICNALFETY